MAISGEFATALQKLLEKLQVDQAELDFQEQVRRRLFSNQEADINQARPGALKQANQSLADRGLVQSGIGLKQHGDIDRNFMTSLANLGQGYGDDLSAFARQRLSNQSDYNWNFADLQKQWAAAEAAKAAEGLLGNPNPVSVVPPAPPVKSAVSPVKPVASSVAPVKPMVPTTPAIIPVKPVVPAMRAGVINPRQPSKSAPKKVVKVPTMRAGVINPRPAKPKTPVIGARGGY